MCNSALAFQWGELTHPSESSQAIWQEIMNIMPRVNKPPKGLLSFKLNVSICLLNYLFM